MVDYAWMSVAAKNPDFSFAISPREVLDGPEPEKVQMLDALRKTESGEPVPDDALPKSLFAWRGPHDESKPITCKLPHFSSCGGFWILTAEAASVFRQFDLGGCKLHPIEIFMEDRQTPLPGQYFLLDFDSWKNVFVPDASPCVKMMRGSTTRRSPNLLTSDDAAVLSRDALVGADIWWNPHVLAAFFLSDRLIQALKAAKVDKPFTLKRCLIA